MRDTTTKDAPPPTATFRCNIYTRKSTENGIEQNLNTLDARRAVRTRR